MNVSVVTTPPKTLEINQKTEVQFEVNVLESIEWELSVEHEKKVAPRDILKLEQKHNNLRNGENIFAGKLGWAEGVSYEC